MKGLLKKTVYKYFVLGIEKMPINTHLIEHFPRAVHKYGPVWVTSTFGFEGLMGFFKKVVHGTRYHLNQVELEKISCE